VNWINRVGTIVSRLKQGKPQTSERFEDDPVSAMIPSHALATYVGGNAEEFRAVGEHNLRKMRELAGLKPTDRVLEPGCGIGRIAIALTQYLEGGTYVGFDIVAHGIEWCQQEITPRYPAFKFFVADIRNDMYHPEGRLSASEYRFPFEDRTFDFVYLTSVFTHMLPAEVEQYVREIARVLDHGGRVFCTAFVISEQARRHLESGQSERKFVDTGRGFWTDKPGDPTHAVGYDEEYLRRVFGREGLDVVQIVPDLWWTNIYAQDALVARKR
jgi:SAM-dependent methyltransferase